MYVWAVAYLAHLLSDASRNVALTVFAFAILAAIPWAAIAWLRSGRQRRRAVALAVAESLKTPTSYLQTRPRVGYTNTVPIAAIILVAAFIGLGLFFFGSWLTTPLIYHNGEAGEGVVADQYRTADVYNDEPVIGFNVLIRKADGAIVGTGFRTDSFNVYPPANAVRYPPVGARFSVRYLPIHPRDFVIVADDDSEWARSLRCGDLLGEFARAERELGFAPADSAFARARDDALAAARAGGCIPGAS